MEFESGSELELAHKLRQARIARQLLQPRIWVGERRWLEAWGWAKRVAMDVEVKARQSGQPWAEVWTLEEATAWAKARARKEAQAWAMAKKWAEKEAQEYARALAADEAGKAGTGWWVRQVIERAKAKAEGMGQAEAAARARAEAEAWTVAEAAKAADTAEAAEAEAWDKAGNVWRAAAETKARAEAEALLLGEAWGWARQGEARAKGESVPSAVADPSTICHILSSLYHRHAHDLWHRSPETSDDYWSLIHFIAPITRLPLELLQQIFLIIIDETSHPPPVLMRVCKHWYTTVTTIWASLNLGTSTSIDAVTRKLERNQLLDIVVDTDSDRHDWPPSEGAFEAILAAIEASSQWRSFVVESLPAQADLPEELVNRSLHRSSNATISRLATFKIRSACETSPLLDTLLHSLGTSTMASSQLTTVEINSPNVISFLAPAYPSVFRFVKVLSLDTLGIRDPVDLLPHLHQLETFTASHISFPNYHDHINLPLIHTLRRLSLRAVSVQWMSGRTFHILEHCTLLFPLHHQVLHTFRATLPNCKHMTFQGSPLDILNGISAHKLTYLSVTCSWSFGGRGDQQLVQLSSRVLGESRLAPKVLHIGIKATNQAWMNALSFMSGLEELVIHNAQPSSLRAQVFKVFAIQPAHASNLGAASTIGDVGVPLCPSLRRFGLKYNRWLRPSERFDLIPVFASVIRSRQHSNCSLESFRLWTRSDQEDPLELIERSQMSVEGFKRLAQESGIQDGLIDSTAMGLMQVAPAHSEQSSPSSVPSVARRDKTVASKLSVRDRWKQESIPKFLYNSIFGRFRKDR